MMAAEVQDYGFSDSFPTHGSAYIWPAVRKVLAGGPPRERRAFDLGCGNGSASGMLISLGYSVIGIDASETGVAIANSAFPAGIFKVASAYDDLAATFGRFPVVLSLEVVEHLYDPRLFARRMFDLVEPGGMAIVSTPYHAFFKNLALVLTGSFDRHFSPLWDGGHIKFFSPTTLTTLLGEVGFADIRIHRVGRIPPLAMSMVAVARRR